MQAIVAIGMFVNAFDGTAVYACTVQKCAEVDAVSNPLGDISHEQVAIGEAKGPALRERSGRFVSLEGLDRIARRPLFVQGHVARSNANNAAKHKSGLW